MTELDDLWPGSDRAGLLSGLRVVDFGQYLAGPLAAGLLAEQGADVVHVDPPGGPRWDTPANTFLLRDRRRIELDLRTPHGREMASRLVSTADVVVENFRPGVMARLGLDPADCLAADPRLVWVSMPGFGHDDPRAGVPGWEGVVMAAAGGYSPTLLNELMPGDSSEAPLAFTPLPLASVFAAIEAAMAVAAALVARERDGLGQRIEVPLFDALAEAIGVRAVTQERNGPSLLLDFGQGFYRCADGGFVNVIMVQHRHLQWLASLSEVPPPDPTLLDYERLRDDPEAGAALRAYLVTMFATRTAAEWEAAGQQAGVPIARLRSAREWLDEPAATASGCVVEHDDGHGGRFRAPGPAVVCDDLPPVPPRPARPAGADTEAVLAALERIGTPPADRTEGAPAAPRPPALAGVRVLDTTRVVAGPTVAKLLGQLGADVLLVDDDPTTRKVAVPEPVFHHILNRGKRSAVVDLRTEAGRKLFDDLVRDADVIVQNMSMAAAERLGIDAASLRTRAPHAVVTYLNTYGRRGPWAGFRGYAEIANTVTGVAQRTAPAVMESGSSPFIDRPRWPFTDYAAGVIGAFAALLGVLHQRRQGSGALVSSSLVSAAMLEQVLYAIDLPGCVGSEPVGESATGWSPYQRAHATLDGQVFVGFPEERAAAVCGALGVATVDELPAALAELKADEAVERLRSAGAGAHRVQSIAELVAPEGDFAARGLRLEEVSDDTGRIVMLGPAPRLVGTPMRPGPLPEPFGAATAEVAATRRIVGPAPR